MSTIPGGYCRDCKWWDKSSWCFPDSRVKDYGECGLTVVEAYEPLKHSRSLAFGMGREESSLVTRPNFGCVQFEKSNY